jgi:hypothetical protein
MAQQRTEDERNRRRDRARDRRHNGMRVHGASTRKLLEMQRKRDAAAVSSPENLPHSE